ncbi:endothelial cell-specific chemotaxis regulator isoform X1 [Danio rerio]|uniref:Endothelial cell-specific chemotaxis regulator isoform X1 n=1 Tax=Danio rerio TaxID=7955 RepID=A0AC58ID40_DANRE
MEKLLFFLIPLITFSSIISAGNDTNLTSPTPPSTVFSPTNSVNLTEAAQQIENSTTYDDDISNQTSKPTTVQFSRSTVTGESTSSSSFIRSTTPTTISKFYTDTSLNGVSASATKITEAISSTTVFSNISMSEATVTPSPAESRLTLLAFGVMSLILILIVVMVILVAAVNLKGRCCRNTQQHESIKNRDSLVSDSNLTSNGEKENITLVSVRTINTEYNADSPQISSVHSTIVDNDDHELSRDQLISLGS